MQAESQSQPTPVAHEGIQMDLMRTRKLVLGVSFPHPLRLPCPTILDAPDRVHPHQIGIGATGGTRIPELISTNEVYLRIVFTFPAKVHAWGARMSQSGAARALLYAAPLCANNLGPRLSMPLLARFPSQRISIGAMVQ
jgi:hypothetical protein